MGRSPGPNIVSNSYSFDMISSGSLALSSLVVYKEFRKFPPSQLVLPSKAVTIKYYKPLPAKHLWAAQRQEPTGP